MYAYSVIFYGKSEGIFLAKVVSFLFLDNNVIYYLKCIINFN